MQPVTLFLYLIITPIGARDAWAWSINNQGAIVGSYDDREQHKHGFLLNKGVYTVLDFPGATATTALGIDDGGKVYGSYVTDTPQPQIHHFSYQGGRYTTVNESPKRRPSNDLGQRVGFYANRERRIRAFVATPVPVYAYCLWFTVTSFVPLASPLLKLGP